MLSLNLRAQMKVLQVPLIPGLQSRGSEFEEETKTAVLDINTNKTNPLNGPIVKGL